jgi:release factor glutamine methyltransferase
MTAVTVGEALRAARERMDATDARVLLTHVTGHEHAFLAAHPEAELGAAEASRYRELVERRAVGEPVAYLTGTREFYGRTFRVTPAVLIPRPETELLVELALDRLPPHAAGRVLDLGTGSGCIAVTIAIERSRCEIIATDQSVAALDVAQGNVSGQAASNVELRRGDWFSALATGELFDVIVANPPYVATGDACLEEGDLRFEPHAALASGPDGLAAIRAIIDGARAHLTDGGWLLFEHGHSQAAAARELLNAAGYDATFSAQDLAGTDRVSGGRLTLVGGCR